MLRVRVRAPTACGAPYPCPGAGVHAVPQVYGHMQLQDKSAMYCAATLHRQLATGAARSACALDGCSLLGGRAGVRQPCIVRRRCFPSPVFAPASVAHGEPRCRAAGSRHRTRLGKFLAQFRLHTRRLHCPILTPPPPIRSHRPLLVPHPPHTHTSGPASATNISSDCRAPSPPPPATPLGLRRVPPGRLGPELPAAQRLLLQGARIRPGHALPGGRQGRCVTAVQRATPGGECGTPPPPCYARASSPPLLPWGCHGAVNRGRLHHRPRCRRRAARNTTTTTHPPHCHHTCRMDVWPSPPLPLPPPPRCRPRSGCPRRGRRRPRAGRRRVCQHGTRGRAHAHEPPCRQPRPLLGAQAGRGRHQALASLFVEARTANMCMVA